jgi:excisionase family DNA binding protein
MNDRETVTASEAMEILGVSRTTISRLVKRGDLEAYKLTPARNSPLRIYKDSVEELLEERKQ